MQEQVRKVRERIEQEVSTRLEERDRVHSEAVSKAKTQLE